MDRVLINIPRQVARGVPFEVKLLVSHPMESGQRRDQMGQAIPRDIIHRFVAMLDGEPVLEAEFFPAISANPFLSFSAIAEKSGILTLTFADDKGAVWTETAKVTVG